MRRSVELSLMTRDQGHGRDLRRHARNSSERVVRQRHHVRRGKTSVRSAAALTFVTLDGGLKLRRVGQVLLPAFQRVQVFCVPKEWR